MSNLEDTADIRLPPVKVPIAENTIVKFNNTKGNIGCGQTLVGSLQSPKDINEIIFNAMNGEKIAISLSNHSISSLFNPAFEVLDASGIRVGDWERVGNYVFVLPHDGKYLIKIYDEHNYGFGDYSVRLEPVSGYFNGQLNCAYPIDCGETLTSTLSSEKSSDNYRFSAKSGERIAVSLTNLSYSALFNPAFEVLDASGQRVEDWEREGNYIFTIKTDGPHTIKVFDEGWDGKGTYSIRLEPVSGYFNNMLNCAPIIQCNK